MALKNDWVEGDYFSADDQNNVADAVNVPYTESASATLALTAGNGVWKYTAPGAATWTLPSSADVSQGCRITTVVQRTDASMTVNRASPDFIVSWGSVTPVTSIVIQPGGYATFEWRGTAWYVVHYSDLRLPVSATTDSGGVINPDGMYGLYARSALSGSTAINSPSLPRDGHIIRFRFKDNGTARALNWNAIYRAIGVTLPTATVAGKTLYVTTIYNAADNKWDVIDVKQEA